MAPSTWATTCSAPCRPPAYDSPTTRGLFDPSTRVYWAPDAFATPMPAEPVDELPAPMWAEGLAMLHHHALAPWLSLVDRGAYAAQVDRVRALDPAAIVSAHSPVITGVAVGAALTHFGALPDMSPPPHPDQQALDAALSGTAA